MYIPLHVFSSLAKLYLFYSPPTPVENFPPLKPHHHQTSPKTPRGVMYYNSFISVSMLQGQHPISAAEPSVPRTDQPPARGGRLVCLSCRAVILWPSLSHKHIRAKLPEQREQTKLAWGLPSREGSRRSQRPYPFQNPSKHVKAHTFFFFLSGPPGSNTSLQYITVTKSSVSERLMMLCV